MNKWIVAWLDYEDFYVWSSYDTKEEAEQELKRIEVNHLERDRWEISHWSVLSIRHGWHPELNAQRETPWVTMMRADEKERVEQRQRQEES